jgi:hypothetical protein
MGYMTLELTIRAIHDNEQLPELGLEDLTYGQLTHRFIGVRSSLGYTAKHITHAV